MNILNLKLWKTWLLAGVTLTVLLHPERAVAVTRTVTSLNDDGGTNTLRFLINVSGPGNTINFAVTGTITLTNELPIGRNLTIIGPAAPGLTISGNNANRVFDIFTNATVNISNLTISNGREFGTDGTPPFPSAGFPGGDARGGGILNQGTLNLANCTLRNNSATGGNGGANIYGATAGGAGSGGAIANQGTLNLAGCTLGNNSATGGNGGSWFVGGLTGGAGSGGAIANQGTLNLADCTLGNNSATGGLGGNSADGLGGTGGDALGGGLFESGSGSYLNTIIANNTSSAGSGGGSGPTYPNGERGVALAPDVDGSVNSQGHNLIGRRDGSSGWVGSDVLGGTTYDTRLDPLLGPLQDNGGSTFTMALLPGSTAIDAGDDVVLNAPLSLPTDQRSLPRKIGSHVDIGAIEYEPPQPGPNYVVTTTDDHNDGTAGGIDCTLREAILAANADANGSTITFAPGVTGTVPLTQGELLISNNLTITGPTLAGVQISGNQLSRVFHVTSGTVSLSNLTLRDGFAEGYSVGLFGPGFDGNGGGILNEATLTLTACTLAGNIAMGGLGGISNIRGVPAGAGGNGNGGGLFNQGTLHLINCSLSSNSAAGGPGGLVSDFSARGGNGGSGNGGALFNQGTLTVTHCTFSSNSVTGGSAGPGNPFGNNGSGNGGGLYNSQGSSTISSSLIAGNHTAGNGPDLSGLFTSGSYNLIGQSDGSSGFSNGVNQDQVGSIATPVPPLLGPLADNGEPTPTMALLTGSPAIDKGGSGGPATDQRGRQRPYDFSSILHASGGDDSDIGAFELNPVLLTPPFLKIARSANDVVLSWSTSDTGFTLEAKASLNPAIPWTTVPATPAIIGSQYVVTNGPATGNTFYRLRNP